jgi:hypothetical protein
LQFSFKFILTKIITGDIIAGVLERLRQRISPRPQDVQVEFVPDGVFEDFVRNGRIPDFWDAGDRVLVVLPPEGTKPGDEYELICGGGIEYFHPNGGPSKGLASLHEVSLDRASRLKEIKRSVLEEMQLITS